VRQGPSVLPKVRLSMMQGVKQEHRASKCVLSPYKNTTSYMCASLKDIYRQPKTKPKEREHKYFLEEL
jgi:hypothetical protein